MIFTTRFLFAFFTILTLPQLLSSQDWTIQEIGRGAKPSLTIDFLDRLHFSYLGESFSNGYIEYALIDQDSITTSRFDEGGFYEGPPAIGLNRGGLPNIILHDHITENQVYYNFNNNVWAEEQIVSDNHDGWDNSLDYDSEGRIHVASTDFVDGVEYAYRSDMGWIKEALPSGPVMYNGSTSIVMDSKDQPHIVYHNPAKAVLEYAVKKNNVWTITTIEANGTYADMVRDQNDHMYVCYLVPIDTENSIIKMASQAGPNWLIETIDTLTKMGPIQSHALAIQRGSNGGMHISYGDNEVIKYARKVSNIWEIETVFTTSGQQGTVGGHSDMVLDSKNNPHITYYLFPDRVRYATKTFETTEVDLDDDGFNSSVDCNDNDANINPGATEIPNNDIDENCDGDTLRTTSVIINGRVVDRNGAGVANVRVISTNNSFDPIITDGQGRWQVTNLERSTTVIFEKNDNVRNGLSAQDLLLTRNHILGRLMLQGDALLAADTNGNGTISVTDIVLSANVLLQRQNEFPGGKSWIFNPNEISVDLNTSSSEITINGIKLGDTNGNADPQSN